MNGPTKVSIFLSSPADVAPEREAAEWVVQRLNGVYAAHVELAATRWERRFYEADRGFQEAIAPMEAFDIVVSILWKRIGSELPPDRFSRPDGTLYESGTVYEIETALDASRHSGRPSVYIFKSQRPITYTAERVDEERAQKEALDRWWGRTFRDEAGRYVAATNSFGDTEDFAAKFENCLVGWLRERGHIPGGPVWDVKTQGSPYPGLVAYDHKHSPVFFGRHLAVESAREELLGTDAREGGLPALFVIGASGSGKSSLVRAGLVPRLTRPGVVPGVDLWRTVITLPTTDSLGPLAAHLYAPDGLPELAAGAQRNPERWARMAAGDPEAAADSLAWALDRIGEAEQQRVHADRKVEARLLLVVDQLEGLFGTTGQEAFAKVLRALVGGGRVWLLATLRSDRYADLQLDRALLALKRVGATYDLPPPGPAEIADIVKGPARAAGLDFAKRDGRSLARVLVEAAPNADALPLLQMTLTQLFDRREGAELTFAAYEAMGGIEGAIATYADGVFARVPPAAQREFDSLVRALVRDVVRSRSDDQVRFTARDAARKVFETSEARKHIVEVLVDGRLLVSDGGKLRVAHEALLRRWERARDSLRRLADAELRRARLQRALAIAAAFVFLAVAGVAIWQGLEAQRQTQIAEKQTKVAQHQEAEAKHQAQIAEKQTKVAQHQEAEAKHQAQIALSRLLAGQSLKNSPEAGGQLDLALLLSVAAHRIQPTLEAQGSLFSALIEANRVKKFVPTDDTLVSLAVSPEGSTIATGDFHGGIVVWDAETLEARATMQQGKGVVESVSFSPDGGTLASAGSGRLVLWDALSGRERRELEGGHRDVDRAVWHPDGSTLFSGSRNEPLIFVWDVATGSRRTTIPRDPLKSFAVSPDGATIASAAEWEGEVRLWDVANHKERMVLQGHRGAVRAVAFSRDGALLASASEDATIIIWDVASGAQRMKLEGQTDRIESVAFSPDGKRLASGSNNRTIMLWDLAIGKPLELLLGHTNGVMNVAFTPEGNALVSNAFDSTLIVWDVGISRQRALFTGHEGDVRTVAVSPDGATLASGGEDRTVRLWDVASGRERAVLQQHRGEVNAVAFSPDGGTLASGSDDDRRIILWDAASGRKLGEIDGDGDVTSLAFSPDGRTLASGAELNGPIFLWDVVTGKRRAELRGHETGADALEFSRDGKVLVSGGGEGSIRVWDPSTRTEIMEPMGAGGSVARVAISPDGRAMASSAHLSGTLLLWDLWGQSDPVELDTRGSSGAPSMAYSPDSRTLAYTSGELQLNIVLWDLTNGTPRATLEGGATTLSMAFTPDGRRLVTGHYNGEVALWDVDLESWPRRACEIANRNLTRDEWKTFVGEGLPYRAVCPELPVPRD